MYLVDMLIIICSVWNRFIKIGDNYCILLIFVVFKKLFKIFFIEYKFKVIYGVCIF